MKDKFNLNDLCLNKMENIEKVVIVGSAPAGYSSYTRYNVN